MIRPRRVAAWFAASGVFLAAVAASVTCVGPPWYYAEKYSGAGPSYPRPFPDRLRPVRQTEPHTCGLCAMTAVYTAYGLDAAAQRLRFRSGVDKPVINFIPGTRGTIHPDMYRVLRQDGFDAESIDPADEQTLGAHLDRGHPAIALLATPSLHWVVVAERHGDRLVVCDSLRADTYEEPAAAYLERVHTMILVEPAAR